MRTAHNCLRIAPEEESDRTAVRALGAGVQNSAVFCARSASAGGGTRYFSQCLIFWCFWIKPKAQEKSERRKTIGLIFREASRPFDSAFPANSSFYHLLTPKGGTKSVRQAKSSGNGRRMHLKRYSASSRPRFRRRIRRPFFFPLFRNAERLCASRNHDFDSFYSVLAGLQPAGLHCENSG